MISQVLFLWKGVHEVTGDRHPSLFPWQCGVSSKHCPWAQSITSLNFRGASLGSSDNHGPLKL